MYLKFTEIWDFIIHIGINLLENMSSNFTR